MTKPSVTAFFDEATFTVTYVVSDPATGRAAVIDPVLDFDPASGRTSTTSADQVVVHVSENNLGVDWILETHVHADHLSGAPYIREKLGGQAAIGKQVTAVQEAFKGVFNLRDLMTDGSQFDHLFDDAESFAVGDTLFMPDFGSARTDFPGGSAPQLYDSIRKIMELPGDTRLFMCHDYKAPGRDVYAWETSVDEQRKNNIHINETVSRDAFVELREGRDSQLVMPKLILPALQVNLRAGELPQPEDNDIRYLKIPLDAV